MVHPLVHQACWCPIPNPSCESVVTGARMIMIYVNSKWCQAGVVWVANPSWQLETEFSVHMGQSAMSVLTCLQTSLQATFLGVSVISSPAVCAYELDDSIGCSQEYCQALKQKVHSKFTFIENVCLGGLKL